MERKKRNKTIKVGESHLVQLLFSILFIAIFLLVMYAYALINVRGNTNLRFDPERMTFHADEKADKSTMFINDEWLFFPNLRIENVRTYKSLIDYTISLPYASNVTINSKGWDDLGNNIKWHNAEKGTGFIPFMNGGMRMVSGAYMANISVNDNINTLYLDLGKVKGHAYIFCNGYLVGNTGDSSSFRFLPDYTGGYSSTAVQNKNNSIQLIILFYSNEMSTQCGLNSTPALYSESKNEIMSSVPSAFIAVLAVVTLFAVVGGALLRKTLSDSRSYYFFALLSLSLFFYTLINGNFLRLATPYKELEEYAHIISANIFSYWFISTLFTKFRLEHQHKYFNMDSVILTCGGIMLMALALLDSRLLSTSFKTTTLIIFVLVLTISNFIKIIFFYISAPNSTHALCSSISLFFIFLHILLSNNQMANCPLYGVCYLIAILALVIYFVQRYISQYSELIHSSEHLKTIVEEKTAHISMINRDLYNTNKRLLENEEARKNVMSNVSHDLRTPITAIRGYSELLLQSGSGLSEDQRQVYLQNIVKRSQQMERIVSDIVEISKMESSGFSFEFMDISINELLDELYMLYTSDLRNSDKKIVLDIPDDDLLITKADPKRISRVFENLISNAINYSKEEALIEIKAWRSGAGQPLPEQRIHITVKDNGIGIPPEEIDHIFDRFYRAKNSGQNIKGTGLGLSIVKMIIDKHDAEISVESVLGEYTIFHVILKPTY